MPDPYTLDLFAPSPDPDAAEPPRRHREAGAGRRDFATAPGRKLASGGTSLSSRQGRLEGSPREEGTQAPDSTGAGSHEPHVAVDEVHDGDADPVTATRAALDAGVAPETVRQALHASKRAAVASADWARVYRIAEAVMLTWRALPEVADA